MPIENEKTQEISVAQYMDILFNMVVSKTEFNKIESLNDFIEVLEKNLMYIVDIEETHDIDIIWVEKVDEGSSFVIHSKDKHSFNIDGKKILVFLI